jgi:hypothetical protein
MVRRPSKERRERKDWAPTEFFKGKGPNHPFSLPFFYGPALPFFKEELSFWRFIYDLFLVTARLRKAPPKGKPSLGP